MLPLLDTNYERSIGGRRLIPQYIQPPPHEAMATVKQTREEIRKNKGKRGNPNQWRLVEQLRSLGYRVTVRRNQICIEDQEPMTINMAKEFIEKHYATYSQVGSS